MTLRALGAVGLSWVLAFGCAAPSEAPVPETAEAPRLQMERQLSSRSIGPDGEPCADGDTACASARLVYPEVVRAPRPELAATINRKIRELLLTAAPSDTDPATPEQLIEEFLAEYQEIQRQFPDSAMGWGDDREVEVIFQSGHLLSLRATVYTYAGGAHPNTAVAVATLELTDGEQLTREKILLPGAEPRLVALAERRFREARGLTPDESLADAGFVFSDSGEFALNENFAIVDGGIVFHYDPYEIAPYALGPTELLLGWEELRGIVQPSLAPRPGARRKT
ncbi:MAG: DUF3298 and DUF4163 domain-containing protein [Acidobacteriota bacterium]|nr:DUF3298 and DUF4163 domain-containing protein [Acidobacteriota bacterium]